jgi:hypothetical protein
LNGIFTVTVPQRSVLSARAIVNYARTEVPFSAEIIRTIPSPETGNTIDIPSSGDGLLGS